MNITTMNIKTNVNMSVNMNIRGNIKIGIQIKIVIKININMNPTQQKLIQELKVIRSRSSTQEKIDKLILLVEKIINIL